MPTDLFPTHTEKPIFGVRGHSAPGVGCNLTKAPAKRVIRRARDSTRIRACVATPTGFETVEEGCASPRAQRNSAQLLAGEHSADVDQRGLSTIRCRNVVTASAEVSGDDAITRLVALGLARWCADRDATTLRRALLEALKRLDKECSDS